jgi:hypothetical protein
VPQDLTDIDQRHSATQHFGGPRMTQAVSTDPRQARPVAGAPVGAHLDPGSPTTIFVPQRHYPHGYAVHVDGGRVVSPPSVRVVEIAAVIAYMTALNGCPKSCRDS